VACTRAARTTSQPKEDDFICTVLRASLPECNLKAITEIDKTTSVSPTLVADASRRTLSQCIRPDFQTTDTGARALLVPGLNRIGAVTFRPPVLERVVYQRGLSRVCQGQASPRARPSNSMLHFDFSSLAGDSQPFRGVGIYRFSGTFLLRRWSRELVTVERDCPQSRFIESPIVVEKNS